MKIDFKMDPELGLREKGTILVCLELVRKGINPTILNIKQTSADAETSIGSSLKILTHLGYFKAEKFKVVDGPGFNWRYTVLETREV